MVSFYRCQWVTFTGTFDPVPLVRSRSRDRDRERERERRKKGLPPIKDGHLSSKLSHEVCSKDVKKFSGALCLCVSEFVSD